MIDEKLLFSFVSTRALGNVGGDGRRKIKLIFITQINFLPFVYGKFRNSHFSCIFRIPSELTRLQVRHFQSFRVGEVSGNLFGIAAP